MPTLVARCDRAAGRSGRGDPSGPVENDRARAIVDDQPGPAAEQLADPRRNRKVYPPALRRDPAEALEQMRAKVDRFDRGGNRLIDLELGDPAVRATAKADADAA